MGIKMKSSDWKSVTRENVLHAIEKFLNENPDYPEPRSTYLLYEGHKLPAKHIRGMAFEDAFGREIRKDEYSGGMETVRFFKNLGFQTLHVEKTRPEVIQEESRETREALEERSSATRDFGKKVDLKICMYLQTEGKKNKRAFLKAMDLVKNSDIDILVFPEFCYIPFIRKMEKANILAGEDREEIIKECENLSNDLGCAVIVNTNDVNGFIYSVYANASAVCKDTHDAIYIKHTMTQCSAFELDDYADVVDELFEPIDYKGYKLGITTCYDCNHAIFSRLYGLKGVDLILNSTGGDVVYQKWYRYNQVRSIENHCYSLVTMGGYSEKNYVYGFNRMGGLLNPVLLNGKSQADNNFPGGLYLYDLSLDDGHKTEDIAQAETENKYQDFMVPEKDMGRLLENADLLSPKLYVRKWKDWNLVIGVLEEDDIEKPEKVLPLLYSKKLRDLPNKRYILVSHYRHIDEKRFKEELSSILKVRAMENFCAVILYSDKENHCYQTGKAKNPQMVKAVDGYYGIDLSRTTGPEAIFRNKEGFKASWRKNFELLVDKLPR